MIIWLTGQPESGKSTIGNKLQEVFHRANWRTIRLDGDAWRKMTLNNDYSEEGRRRNVREAMTAALALDDADMIVICSFVSPFRDQRDDLKRLGTVLEVYCFSNRTTRQKFACPKYEPPAVEYIQVNGDMPLMANIDTILKAVGVDQPATSHLFLNGGGI
jgi:phosphoribulokinase